MPVSRTAMALLLRRLAAAFGKPFTDAKVEAQATEYAKAMGQIPDYAVEWAVDGAVKSLERYPKPAELRKLALTCPRIPQGNHDQSLRSQMQVWEACPWPEVWESDEARQDGRSLPCPVCGSCLVPSPRGFVIVHDDRMHREARCSFSNVGRPEWFELGPPVMPEPRKRPKPKPSDPPAPMSVGEVYGQVLVNTLPKGALPPGTVPPTDERWDEEQQQIAAAGGGA